MTHLLQEIRHRKLLWLLVFVPVLLVVHHAKMGSDTLQFLLSILAIVPLAALLSHATEAVAGRTGDAVGGLINATLGNMTELVIALTALAAGQYMLVKASIAGVVVTNVLFMLGLSMVLGGARHHIQTFNKPTARLQAALLMLVVFALLVPSIVSQADKSVFAKMAEPLSLGLAALLIAGYACATLFQLKTHKELFTDSEGGHEEVPLSMTAALTTLAVVTVLIALTSEIFVHSVQHAAQSMGMTPAFVGFIVVPLVGGAAEMASAFNAARKNRLNMSIGIAMGSATQISLFVAPVLLLASYFLGPTPMDLLFWPGAIVMMMIAAFTASTMTSFGASTWFNGVQLLMVWFIFALTLYLLPPAG